MFIFTKIQNQTTGYEALDEDGAVAWMTGIGVMVTRLAMENSVWFAKGLPGEAGIDGATWIRFDAWEALADPLNF